MVSQIVNGGNLRKREDEGSSGCGNGSPTIDPKRKWLETSSPGASMSLVVTAVQKSENVDTLNLMETPLERPMALSMEGRVPVRVMV